MSCAALHPETENMGFGFIMFLLVLFDLFPGGNELYADCCAKEVFSTHILTVTVLVTIPASTTELFIALSTSNSGA